METWISILLSGAVIPVIAYLLKRNVDESDKKQTEMQKRMNKLESSFSNSLLNIKSTHEKIKLDLENRASSIEKVMIKLESETRVLISNSATKEEFAVAIERLSGEIKIDLARLKEKADLIERHSKEDFGLERALIETAKNQDKKIKALYQVIKKIVEKINKR